MTAWVMEISEEVLSEVTKVPQGKWKRYVSVLIPRTKRNKAKATLVGLGNKV